MLHLKLVVFAQVAALSLIALYFLYTRLDVAALIRHETDSFQIPPNGPAIPTGPTILTPQNLVTYTKAILDPEDKGLPKLECPHLDWSRYGHLQPESRKSSQTRYFFALNLRNCLRILPRLLGSIVEAIRFLGPENCALSIVEGNSPDGTAEVLAALLPNLTKLSIRTHLVLNNTINPLPDGDYTGAHRFLALAELRNLALAPLVADKARYAGDSNTTVIFINDVVLCPDDILELVHQRRHQNADIACAMDWVGDFPPIFYDAYVARAINGDTFFNIPPETESWAHAPDLFWNEPVARARLEKKLPFQVFSCWNGALAFTARPFVEGQVAFRGAREKERGECRQGEPQTLCKDMWFQGYGKIMVVPTVNVVYENEKASRIKEMKGFASQGVAEEAEAKIEWLPPPDQVKCMPAWKNQTWRPWNETLT